MAFPILLADSPISLAWRHRLWRQCVGVQPIYTFTTGLTRSSRWHIVICNHRTCSKGATHGRCSQATDLSYHLGLCYVRHVRLSPECFQGQKWWLSVPLATFLASGPSSCLYIIQPDREYLKSSRRSALYQCTLRWTKCHMHPEFRISNGHPRSKKGAGPLWSEHRWSTRERN